MWNRASVEWLASWPAIQMIACLHVRGRDAIQGIVRSAVGNTVTRYVLIPGKSYIRSRTRNGTGRLSQRVANAHRECHSSYDPRCHVAR